MINGIYGILTNNKSAELVSKKTDLVITAVVLGTVAALAILFGSLGMAKVAFFAKMGITGGIALAVAGGFLAPVGPVLAYHKLHKKETIPQ